MAEQASQQSGQSADNAFDALLTYVLRERGLDCSQYKASFLHRRLATRMRVRKVGAYLEYLAVLHSNPTELDALLAALSINLSYFFRDELVFDVLKYAVLAPLVAGRAEAGPKSLTLWSAGCADGEEPYSLAMILADLLGTELSRWSVLIHATDVDAAALARAREGAYRAASFRNLQADFVSRYFLRQGDTYVPLPEIRELVTFRRHDLTTVPLLPQHDLILCRNVLIYFTREHQDHMLRHLLDYLRPGGYLVLGMTEMLPLSLAFSGCLQAVDSRLRIYRKPA